MQNAPEQRMTLEEFLSYDAPGQFELYDGVLTMSPSPNRLHQRISVRLCHLIETYLDQNQLGHLYLAPFDVLLNPTRVVQPDLMYVSTENAHIETTNNLQGAPDWVIEISSPSTVGRELITKKHYYETAGVKEYWIIHPEYQLIELFRLENDKYSIMLAFDNTMVITTPLLPSFTINLADFWGKLT
jgi:Uma2 family endonuclease